MNSPNGLTGRTHASLVTDDVLPARRSLWGDVWSQFRTHKGALVGAAVFFTIVLGVVLGPYIHT